MDFYLDVQFLLKHVKKNLWNLSKSDCFDKKNLVCKLYIEIRIYCIYFSNFSLHFCFCSYFFSLLSVAGRKL